MKVKNKLRLGFGFLFIVVLLFGGISLYYINRISNNAKVILKDNYETLNYCREMRGILDENNLPLTDALIYKFDKALVKEEHNITEKGEGRTVADLRTSFKILQDKSSLVATQIIAQRDIRRDLL